MKASLKSPVILLVLTSVSSQAAFAASNDDIWRRQNEKTALIQEAESKLAEKRKIQSGLSERDRLTIQDQMGQRYVEIIRELEALKKGGVYRQSADPSQEEISSKMARLVAEAVEILSLQPGKSGNLSCEALAPPKTILKRGFPILVFFLALWASSCHDAEAILGFDSSLPHKEIASKLWIAGQFVLKTKDFSSLMDLESNLYLGSLVSFIAALAVAGYTWDKSKGSSMATQNFATSQKQAAPFFERLKAARVIEKDASEAEQGRKAFDALIAALPGAMDEKTKAELFSKPVGTTVCELHLMAKAPPSESEITNVRVTNSISEQIAEAEAEAEAERELEAAHLQEQRVEASKR